jgi:hypothetical protein
VPFLRASSAQRRAVDGTAQRDIEKKLGYGRDEIDTMVRDGVLYAEAAVGSR